MSPNTPTRLTSGLRLLPVMALAFTGVPALAGDTETTLRERIAWQTALDRVGFSPGLIDGRVGPKTALATREFQRVHGLPQTGRLDAATADELKCDPDGCLGKYRITAADLAEVGPAPESWIAKSRLERLGHQGLENVIAEKFHCAVHLLQTLNPGRNINGMKPGDQVVVPAVLEAAVPVRAARIEVNLAEKVIRVIDEENRLAALFHCSIAKDKEKRPTGKARVTGVAFDPTYTFRPEMWPEVRERVPGPLTIPPGPRNPVGRCWVSLSLPGYGMHGTPNPELIGKTGSHGCFRLTNWDAIRLGKMVQPGTPVRFSSQPEYGLASMQK